MIVMKQTVVQGTTIYVLSRQGGLIFCGQGHIKGNNTVIPGAVWKSLSPC